MTRGRADVIVVGAGFAGLAAARRLTHAGRSVTILEARADRRPGVGPGRGGDRAHWTQPHLWSELHRYGLELEPAPVPQQVRWWDGDEGVLCSPDEFMDLLGGANDLLTGPARRVFPQPFAPLASSRAVEFDGISVREAIAALSVPSYHRAVAEAFWGQSFRSAVDDVAYSQLLRRAALTGGDWTLFFEACFGYRIKGGTRALAERLRDDVLRSGRGDLVHGADVRRIVRETEGVRVVTATGEERRADDVVLAVPIEALDRIVLAPPLPRLSGPAEAQGRRGRGTTVWFRVRGEHPAFMALGEADWPLSFFQSERARDGCTRMSGTGTDGSALAAADLLSVVRESLDRLAPGFDVIDVVAHDEGSRAGRSPYRRGFLTGELSALQRPGGRVHLAGSDIADGWSGFIDGALESGRAAARRILSG